MSVDILLQISRQFDPGNVFHTCMAALFLVAFFSFLQISNLVPRTLGDLSHHSPLFLRRSSVKFSARGAVLSVTRTKTLQFSQRILEIPLPLIPGSPLCPVSALSAYLQRVPAEPFSPLFGVYINNQYQPILAHHYKEGDTKSGGSLLNWEGWYMYVWGEEQKYTGHIPILGKKFFAMLTLVKPIRK